MVTLNKDKFIKIEMNLLESFLKPILKLESVKAL